MFRYAQTLNTRVVTDVTRNVRNFQTNAMNRLDNVTAAKAHESIFAVPKYRTPLTQSHCHGACDVPLITSTLGDTFDRMSGLYPDSNFSTSLHQPSCLRLTYAEISEKVDSFALSLAGLGFVHGDRIAIWSTNNIEWLITMYAAAKLGLVLVNLNPAYQQHELEYTLNKVECKGIVFAQKFKTTSNLSVIKSLFPEAAVSRSSGSLSDTYVPLEAAAVPSLRHLIHLGTEGGADLSNEQRVPGMLAFWDVLSHPAHFHSDTERVALPGLRARCSIDDVINIQFTSGTTGFPKATALTHTNVVNNGFFVGEALRLAPRDRILLSVPLFHCFGMVMGSIAAITHGSALVLPSATFSPSKAVQAAATEKCSILHGVPTMFITMLASPEFHQHQTEIKKNSRSGIMAGSPCPEAVMRQVLDEMGAADMTVCYGMTETSPVSLQTHADDPLEMRVGTVGRPHPHLEVKVADERGRAVAVGESGEICTRGYSVMRGYWSGCGVDTETTDKSIVDGWMQTGDLGTMDEDGYVRVVGRKKDLIIRGGENVPPREIEELLYRHPLVQDAQVVGVPDPVMGEEVAVWVIARAPEDAAAHVQSVEEHSRTGHPEGVQVEAAARRGVHTLTEDEVRAFVGATLAKYKVPRYVKFVNSFPMTVSGKVQKYVMREMYSKELGLV